MKFKPRVSFKKLILSAALLHAIGALSVYYRNNFLLSSSHFFVWPALAMMVYLLIKDYRLFWGGSLDAASSWVATRWVKTAGLFLFVLLFSWQVNYLSLASTQPLMYTAQALPIRYDILPGDLLGYSLRMVLQTWFLALALALVFNRVPRNHQGGYLRGHYQKLSLFAWYIGNLGSVAVVNVVFFSIGLLILDIGKFICKSLGADIMVLPQFEVVILFFALFLFNQALSFTKRLKHWGDTPQSSLVLIIVLQLLFVLFVYCMVQVFIQLLPEETVYVLMQPFYFEFLDFRKYPDYWQLFVTCLSVFMVPLLANYFYYAYKGESVLRSTLRLMILPLMLSAVLVLLIPSTQAVFFEISPTVKMFAVDLNNLTSRYAVSWHSYFSLLICLLLILMLQGSKNLTHALLEMMPEPIGRRIRRVKSFFSRTFPSFLALMSMYLLTGVIITVYFSSLFLLGTLLGITLCFIAGLRKREA